ncbi:MAG: ArdC-like ssDNA-binding domain-containing protein [Thermomicrobiales bacterium]
MPLFTERYSVTNARLIASQFPTATVVLPASEWAMRGRKIRKGEKAIKIFVPKVRSADGLADDIANAPSIDHAAGMLAGEMDLHPRFNLGSAFDIAQTESISDWEAEHGKAWEPDAWKAQRKARKNPQQDPTPVAPRKQPNNPVANAARERRDTARAERRATIAATAGNGTTVVIAETRRIDLG